MDTIDRLFIALMIIGVLVYAGINSKRINKLEKQVTQLQEDMIAFHRVPVNWKAMFNCAEELER